MKPIVVSETKQIFNGKPYYYCGKYFQNDGERLHRVVFEAHKGAIPAGMVVHHIDEDRHNNAIDNLMLMRAGEHSAHHHYGVKENMPVEALLAATEWHGSNEGIEWHKKHYAKIGHVLQRVGVFTCIVCGVEYSAKIRGNNSFCSAKCCTKHRRDSGLDNEDRVCEYCSALFSVNKYKANRFCGRTCSARYNAEKRA